jgi:nickel superoxide dismutase
MLRSRKLLPVIAMMFVLVIFSTSSLFAHCQIPCGIYTDDMRIKMTNEDIDTIEKSMKQIVELSAQENINYNQLVRWITNKEEHANKIQEIVDVYFLTQRIVPVDPADAAAYQDYTKKLVLLHQMLVYAMKCKQTTDLDNVAKLRSLVKQFDEAYFGPAEREHLKEHKE